MSQSGRQLRVFLVAGEPSGDQLGARLIPEIKRLAAGGVQLQGVGGAAMAEEGCPSLFPLSDVAVMGPLAILARLPLIVGRVYQTVDAAVRFRPDVLVILDSPEFTHPIAKRVKRRLPETPVVDYVSPSVWAWRPGRAAKMRAYVDHILALLPFEPAVHARLGGPDCTYVGHPLVERAHWIRQLDPGALAKKLELPNDRPVLVVAPGSRPSEVGRLMEPFGRAVEALMAHAGPVELLVPTVESMRDLIEEAAAQWPVKPHLVKGETEKFQAFRLARAALAASGTVTLELAMSGTPMVVAYKVDALAWSLRWLLKVHSVVLPNLILEENVFPEFLQDRCTPDRLAQALAPLLTDGPERERQLKGATRLKDRMALPKGTPSAKAAGIVVGMAEKRKTGA
jgi:lipid-A-disaccharide synthase